jgi:ubiquinone/menaquinone biosynthesis C-methylase UbiE
MELPTTQKAAYAAQQVGLLLNLATAQRVLRLISRTPFRPNRRARRELHRRFRALLEEDLSNVEKGYYPQSLLFQFPLVHYLRQVPLLAADFPRSVRRMKASAYRDLPSEANNPKYPAYFRRNFHWQSDGYFSRKSADLYDPGVEFLFMGMADVMRRQIIPPIARFVNEGNQDARVLDVGCGTGRSLLQLRAALPGLSYTGLDLSSYYLEFASELLGNAGPISLDEGNAEEMPYEDDSFDVVTSTYLLHELPCNARTRVLREMYRVLRPSGIVVIAGSTQLGDSEELGEFLRNFSKDFHEPFHRDFIEQDLGTALSDAGFSVDSSQIHFVSKVVVAHKPAR